jgi:hypothetical protein
MWIYMDSCGFIGKLVNAVAEFRRFWRPKKPVFAGGTWVGYVDSCGFIARSSEKLTFNSYEK